ncbi:unnamed protein product [Brassica napus]|uniref:(rape) hypothetical protein n=1 Tax=Brassica napus TaxID=3708 RepID=A0A816JUH6_BRANA|nr:unnamed protein product [Brassica napus]
MEDCSEDEMRLNKSTSQKRQRTSTESEEKKKRTGTLLDLNATDCPVCFDSLTIPIFQDLYEHRVAAKHCESSDMFECGTPMFIPLSGKRIKRLQKEKEK